MSAATVFDGFYAGYFTGFVGYSVGVFVFKEGIVVGADGGGGKYDGEYNLAEDGKHIQAKMRFTLPVGHPSITGLSAGPAPMEVPLSLPIEINSNEVHRIQTPIGPINAKFEKIRGA